MIKTTYEERVSREVHFALTDLEALQNWADFVSQIFKLTNVGITGTPNNFDMSCLGDVIDNVIEHIAAEFSAPVHFEWQNENSDDTEKWDQEVGFGKILSHVCD